MMTTSRITNYTAQFFFSFLLVERINMTPIGTFVVIPLYSIELIHCVDLLKNKYNVFGQSHFFSFTC